MRIISLKAREILDSRGIPTVEVNLKTDGGAFKASVPSGTSQGIYEAKDLRDGGARFLGQGVLRAVENINQEINQVLSDKKWERIQGIDQALLTLDSTEDKSRLGANAILAVSVASLRALAFEKDLPLYQYIWEIQGTMELARLVPAGTSRASFTLPVPCFNVINGGQHAGGNLKVQEFMIIPQKETFAENYRMGAEIYQNLKGILSSQYGVSAINVGYEGGFTPALNKTREALDLILQAIEKAGYLAEVKLGLDVAASEFFENGQYNFEEGTMNSQKMIDFYQGLLEDYPIIYLEDPFSQEDFESWGKLKKVTSSRKNLMIIGDDLLVTNVQRIEMAQKQSLCNALILKPNQIGTVTESLKAVSLAQAYGWKVVASHRSGDTCDDFIADLAVGTGANFMKAGGLSRGERVTKYNRLLEIEEELGEISKYRV